MDLFRIDSNSYPLLFSSSVIAMTNADVFRLAAKDSVVLTHKFNVLTYSDEVLKVLYESELKKLQALPLQDIVSILKLYRRFP